ncbi:hypothetical protein C8F01DRAFT_375271 [Mycena amicta]|nr:hypothetical protein C8F01DRAFT_375271 [Mycena amicta]
MDTPPEQTPMREPSSVLSTRRDRNSESETPSTTLKRRRTEDASAGEKSDGESSSLQPRRSKRARATGTISAAIAGPSRTASLSSTPSRTASLLPSTKQESKPRFTQPNGNQLKLSDDFLDKHLNPNSAYLIHPVPSDPVVYVHRIDDLQVHFGGPQQSLISYMPAFMSPPQHPSRKSCEKLTGAFPQPEFNPHLPSEPGAPGLIFASRADIAERGVRFTVFCRKEKESREEHVVWRYMGEYLHERVGTVSGETWKAQSDKVQTTWAKHIMKIERGVYAEMREALRAEKAKKGVTLKPNHIIEALCSGKGVTIGIIQMTCVGYDHAYAERLRIAAMTPAPATASASGSRGSPKTRGSSVKGKGKGKGKQKQQQGPAGRPRRPGTRKSYNPDSDDPHSESEPQPESESEYEDGT